MIEERIENTNKKTYKIFDKIVNFSLKYFKIEK